MNLKHLIVLILLYCFYLNSNAQNSFGSISDEGEKYYLHFYIHEQAITDHYIPLVNDTSLLDKYDGGPLPHKRQLSGTVLVLRSFFRIDKKLSEKELSFHIGWLNYPCRIFCNGKLIYALGSYKNFYTPKSRFSSGVMLPPDFLNYDSINEFSIQIYSLYNETHPLDKVFIASKSFVDRYTFMRNYIGVNLIQATLIVSIILAVYFLFLYFFMMDRNNYKYLLYAAFCVFLSLGYSNTSFSYNFFNDLIYYRISRMSLPLANLFLVYYTVVATRVLKINKLIVFIFAIPVTVFVVMFITADTLADIEDTLKLFTSTINLPYFIFSITLVIISLIKKRKKRDFAFLIAYLILFLTIYADSLHFIYNTTPYTWVIPHGFLFFIIIIFFILSLEQANEFKLSLARGAQLKEIKDNLENIVEERTGVIKAQNEELKAQSESLEHANFEILSHKNRIEKSHKDMTDSILYAGLIQQAVLPDEDIIKMILPSHFILNKPSNIVSGDFYFIRQVRQYTIVCAIDCTGHGVPGAFLSMLGTALLNEIVMNREITRANDVLEELRIQIKKSLQQTGREGERKEGMDIAFCSIDLENMKMSFAGAHNSLWLFRQKDGEISNANDNFIEMIELPADHQSVSISYKEMPFTEHTIDLKKGDMFYVFTDGYASQFSYRNGATFKTKRFKELLSEICFLSMNEQKQILEERFNDWMGNSPQTDDVLVIGVKIG